MMDAVKVARKKSRDLRRSTTPEEVKEKELEPRRSLAPPRKQSTDNTIRTLFPKASRTNQDDVIATEHWTSTKVDQPVKLRIEEGELGQRPITIMSVLRLNVEKYPDRHAYGYKSEDVWQYITYKDVFELVKRAAKGFISFGLQRFYGVAIIGRNSIEWAIANFAAIYAGGIVVPIPPAVSADECYDMLQNTYCNIVVVGSSKQLDTVAQFRSQLINIKAVIMYGTDEDPKSGRIHTWDELLAMGDKVDDERLHERLAFQAPNLCCTIAYTPGTTGPKKPVMLSQDNFIWTSRSMGRRLSCSVASATNIAMLSYAHAGSLIFNLYMPLLFASTVYFISSPHIFDWTRQVQPTTLYAPYIAFEELRLRMTAHLTRSCLARFIFWWSRTIGLRGYRAMINRRSLPCCWSLASSLVYEKIRNKLGLQSSREIFIGGRVVSREALEFFASLNIPVLEIYGASECTGPFTIAAMPHMVRIPSVGKDLDGCNSKIMRPDKNGVGDLLIKGRNVFMGYLEQPELTNEAFDKDGWYKTGDLGRKDADKFLFVFGRASDCLNAQGEDIVVPGPIEVTIREALPILRNCVVVGRGRNYLSALLTIKTVVNWPTYEVSDTLTPEVQEWFRKLGYKEETIDKFLKNPDKRITNQIQAAFDRLNTKLRPSRRIKKWTILPHDFSVQSGELSWTLNIRRFVVEEKYAETIDSMYIEK